MAVAVESKRIACPRCDGAMGEAYRSGCADCGTVPTTGSSGVLVQALAVSVVPACVLWFVVLGVMYALAGVPGIVVGVLAVVGLTTCVLGLGMRRATRTADASRQDPGSSLI